MIGSALATLLVMRLGPVARRSRPPQRRLRALLVGLTAWALFATSLPLHSGLEQHNALDGPTQVWLTHCKPGPARHLESATSVELPRCLACVLQLQGLGTAIPSPQGAIELVALDLAPRPDPRPLEIAAPRLAPSRGPPRA